VVRLAPDEGFAFNPGKVSWEADHFVPALGEAPAHGIPQSSTCPSAGMPSTPTSKRYGLYQREALTLLQ